MNSLQLSDDDPKYFNKWWSWAESSLKDILNFGQNDQNPKFPLEKMILYSNYDYESRNKNGPITLGHIYEFITNMEFLRINDPPLFESFRRKFTSGPGKQFEYLTGFWFEVNVACLFLRKGIKFRCPVPDPPDFEISLDNNNISVECYSPRLSHGFSTYPQLLNSIETKKVKKYRKKKWANDGLSVLFIEGTWILRSLNEEVLGTNYSLPKKINDTILKLQKSSFYDLVVLLFFGRLTESQFNGSTVSCVYAPTKISDFYLATFVGKLLNDFKEETEIKIHLPNLPKDSGSN